MIAIHSSTSSLVQVRQLLAGGPGSGRHREFGPSALKEVKKNDPDAYGIQIKWVWHPKQGLLLDDTPPKPGQQNEEGARLHHVWFKELGLPTAGKKFDDLYRGYALIHHPEKEVYVRTHGDDEDNPRSAPPGIVSAVQRMAPSTKGYKFFDSVSGDKVKD